MLRFLIGFAILVGVLMGLAEVDATGRYGLLICAAVLLTGLGVEWALFKVPPAEALRRLGLGRPGSRALLAGAAIAALMRGAYPLTLAATGSAPQLKAEWPWLLIGVLAFHGVAEELVWRGYAFRRLRERSSFAGAVLRTRPLVAVTHLPIFVSSGAAVGLAALVVAAVTSLPLAYLVEKGRGTIWPAALVHAGIDSFKLVDVPEDLRVTFWLLLAALSIVVPLLVFAVPRSWLEDR